MSYAIETKKRKFHRVLESLSKPLSGDSSTKSSNNAAVTSTTARERPTTQDLSIKKACLDGNSSAPSSVRKSLLKISRQSSRSSSTSSTSRPNFVPWDRERFLERLETFRRVDRWSSKPAEINEVQWSKRGWICTDTSRVTCVGGCGNSVVIKLPDEIDELDGYDDEKVQERKEVRSRLVEEYSRLLVEGHGDNCAWRNRGCDATIHRLPLTNPEVAIANLQKRYANLVTMRTQLPAYNTIQTPEGFDLEGIAKILPMEYFKEQDDSRRETHSRDHLEGDPQEGRRSETQPSTTQEQSQSQSKDHHHQSTNERSDSEKTTEQGHPQPSTTANSNNNNNNNIDTTDSQPSSTSKSTSTPQQTQPNNLNKSALALAFFGWDNVTVPSTDGGGGITTTISGLVGCHACFRRLGLWLYKPKENGDLTVYGNLDVVSEHMEYCPWVNKEAQSGSGREPAEKDKTGDLGLRNGWELLSQAVKVKHRRQIRSRPTPSSVDNNTLRDGCGQDHDHEEDQTSEPINPLGDDENKKVADREWWGKIRRMKQVLNVKNRS